MREDHKGSLSTRVDQSNINVGKGSLLMQGDQSNVCIGDETIRGAYQ